MKYEYLGEELKKSCIDDANCELTKIEAMKILAKNNILACEIEISGIKIGLCKNDLILPVLEYQENEIKKFLKDEKNEWE